MPITIGSNIASLQAQRRLSQSSESLSRVYERLGSGMRINRASDDAAGLAIASSLNANVRVFGQAIRNANDGVSMLSIAEGALQQLSGISTRIAELAEQSANGVYSSVQRLSLDKEAQALVSEYNRTVATTKFNGLSLIGDDAQGKVAFQIGEKSTSYLEIELGALATRTTGDGTFGSATYFSSGAPNQTAEVADLNGDGKLDVLSVSASDVLRSYLGNGDGTFKAPQNYAANNTGVFQHFGIGDVNGDGVQDAIVTAEYGQSVNIFIGNGDGSFKTSTTLAIGTRANNSTVGDINNDGKLDFVVGSQNAQGAHVFIGNGDGTFQARVSYALNDPHMTQLADFNNDGFKDVVGDGGIMLGNGDGTFKTPMATSVSRGFDIADFNRDGNADIVSAAPGGGASILLGIGNGSFKSPLVLTTGSASFQPLAVAGDINGDGFSDFIVDEETGNSFGVFLGNGDGTFKARVSYPLGGAPSGFTFGDFNRDGALDIFGAMVSGSGDAAVLLGGVRSTSTLSAVDLTSAAASRVALDDMHNLLSVLAQKLSTIGASQSRLSTIVSNLYSLKENYQAAESRIKDADIAAETSQLVRQQILQQAGAAVLAQANTQPSLALKLLSGF